MAVAARVGVAAWVVDVSAVGTEEAALLEEARQAEAAWAEARVIEAHTVGVLWAAELLEVV